MYNCGRATGVDIVLVGYGVVNAFGERRTAAVYAYRLRDGATGVERAIVYLATHTSQVKFVYDFESDSGAANIIADAA